MAGPPAFDAAVPRGVPMFWAEGVRRAGPNSVAEPAAIREERVAASRIDSLRLLRTGALTVPSERRLGMTLELLRVLRLLLTSLLRELRLLGELNELLREELELRLELLLIELRLELLPIELRLELLELLRLELLLIEL